MQPDGELGERPVRHAEGDAAGIGVVGVQHFADARGGLERRRAIERGLAQRSTPLRGDGKAGGQVGPHGWSETRKIRRGTPTRCVTC